MEMCARSREFVYAFNQIIGHAAQVICVEEVEALFVNANDDKFRIITVASALAKKCDYLLVIVQCAFRSNALTRIDKLMARHAAVPFIFYFQRAVLNIHGPVRKTNRAKHRRASAQDPARVAV